MFGPKKRNFFDDFDTDFDSRSDTSDDNNVREFGFVVDQHISDQFDDKTSGDECSVMGDNSAGIYIYIGLLIFLISNSTSDADSNPRPDPPLCILARTRW